MRALCTADGQLVLPWTGGGIHAFRAVGRDGALRGRVAWVREVPETPESIAVRELAVTGCTPDPEVAQAVAEVVADELGWLQDVPEGSAVRISERGRMRLRATADLAWHRADARAWAARQRAEGYLPLLLTVRGRVRVTALRWEGSLAIVEVAAVLARLTAEGIRPSHLEVL